MLQVETVGLQQKHIEDKEYIESLFHEARAAAKLNHPNIVQAYAVGEDEGIYYFAMEFIRGETLAVDLSVRDKYVAAQNEAAAEAAGGSGGAAPRSLADLNGHPAAISLAKA